MDRIDRRTAIKVAGAAGIAFPVGAAQELLTTSGARAQAAPPRSGTWPNRRLLDRLKLEHPIVQAPMGGHVTVDMPAAVSAAGGLGSFPSALLTPAQLRDAVGKIRAKSAKPLNLNFFCNAIPQRRRWRAHGANGSLPTTPSSGWTSLHPRPTFSCRSARRCATRRLT
jgi:Nitronate monooxygenase